MSIFKKQRVYWIDYRINGRRRREKIGPSYTLARTVLRKRKVEIAEGRFLDKKKQEFTKFEDFTSDFLELYSKPNKKSWKSDYYNFESLKKVFKNKYLHAITQKEIEEYKVTRKKTVASATVNRELATLKTMFAKAVEWEAIDSNPAKNVKFFKENNIRLRYLEKGEIKKLLSNCPARIRPIIIVALHTGMRRGEIFKLKWQDVDIKRDILHLFDTKNGCKREIPMNKFVKKTLIGVRKHPDSPYIFCKPDGSTYTNIRKSFLAALIKCGIINFRFHDLRHTFASQLVMAGIDLNTVRELLGHKDIKMTLRYAHLSPDHKARAVEILDQQMDTIWTPSTNSVNMQKHDILQPIEMK